jgi:hypothetical protein
MKFDVCLQHSVGRFTFESVVIVEITRKTEYVSVSICQRPNSKVIHPKVDAKPDFRKGLVISCLIFAGFRTEKY